MDKRKEIEEEEYFGVVIIGEQERSFFLRLAFLYSIKGPGTLGPVQIVHHRTRGKSNFILETFQPYTHDLKSVKTTR